MTSPGWTKERVCKSETCETSFTATTPNGMYCESCRKAKRTPRQRSVEDRERRSTNPLGHRHDVSYPNRICQSVGCGKKIPVFKALTTKYCGEQCSDREKKRRSQKRNKSRLDLIAEGEKLGRRGAVFELISENGMAQLIFDGDLTIGQCAELISKTPAGVSRGFEAWKVDRLKRLEAEDWEMAPEIAAMFPVEKLAELKQLGLHAEGTEEFEALMFQIEFSFWQFEHRYFTIGSDQRTFITYEFHVETIREFIIARVFGAKVLILTPPRHGKSEMVLRFMAWLIIMYPNIQVLWVASNSSLAAAMCGKIRGVFEHSTLLIKETLPPSAKYGDKGAPKWTETEFTLYTRTDYTLKSATFSAIGSTATVAGRDVDFGGIDDLEERKTVNTPEQRHKSKEKHAEIMERQEPHTGFVTIASRQHPDDIPNTLMQQEGTLAWRVHAYPAHDENCTLDEDLDQEFDNPHDTNGCVLAPLIVPYWKLMENKRSTDALGLPGRFELRFLQKAIPVDGMVFNIRLIRKHSLDRSRIMGEINLNINYRLIAGMDPAPRGYQAAYLYAWTKFGTYVIEIKETKGAGQLGAVQLFEDWYHTFGLTHWVYEDNMAKQDFFTRPDLIGIKMKYGLIIEKHTTGNEKRDAEVGISSMAPWYHTGKIILPYGNADSVAKTKKLLSQLQLWTTDGLQKGATVTDIKIASWLPFVKRLVRWDRAETAAKLELTSDQSYPALTGDTPAWGYTDPSAYGLGDYGG